MVKPPLADPDPQTLHERAGESARETRTHIIGLATGSLALFFIALTGKTDPVLTTIERVVVMSAVLAHAAAVGCGLWSAYADAQWSNNWARQIQAGGEEPKAAFKKAVDEWHGRKRWSEQATIGFFAVGVLLSAIYLAFRVFA